MLNILVLNESTNKIKNIKKAYFEVNFKHIVR